MIFYRPIMRLAHRFNWHYAPPIYPDGDTQLWCKWCGFRQAVKSNPPRIADAIEKALREETGSAMLRTIASINEDKGS